MNLFKKKFNFFLYIKLTKYNRVCCKKVVYPLHNFIFLQKIKKKNEFRRNIFTNIAQ